MILKIKQRKEITIQAAIEKSTILQESKDNSIAP
jgi:hypothetical protein